MAEIDKNLEHIEEDEIRYMSGIVAIGTLLSVRNHLTDVCVQISKCGSIENAFLYFWQMDSIKLAGLIAVGVITIKGVVEFIQFGPHRVVINHIKRRTMKWHSYL